MISESTVEHIVHELMNRFDRNSLQSQAVLQAYCGVALPGYPTMEEAGIVDRTGSFLIAGERIKLLQRQAVHKARSELIKIKDSNSLFEEAIDTATGKTFEVDCFHSFVKKIAGGTGRFLDEVSSST